MITASIVIQLHGSDAPLAGPLNILGMRAPPQISSDLVGCIEGGQSSSTGLGGDDSGQGCLCPAVLYGTNRSMPAV